MHGINGRLYANLEGLTACVGDTILWHLVGFGSEVDIHTLRISGHSFLSDKHRFVLKNVQSRKVATGQRSISKKIIPCFSSQKSL